MLIQVLVMMTTRQQHLPWPRWPLVQSTSLWITRLRLLRCFLMWLYHPDHYSMLSSCYPITNRHHRRWKCWVYPRNEVHGDCKSRTAAQERLSARLCRERVCPNLCTSWSDLLAIASRCAWNPPAFLILFLWVMMILLASWRISSPTSGTMTQRMTTHRFEALNSTIHTKCPNKNNIIS